MERSLKELEKRVSAGEMLHEHLMWLGHNFLNKNGEPVEYRAEPLSPSIHPALYAAAGIELITFNSGRKAIVCSVAPGSEKALRAYFKKYGGKKR